MIKEDRHVGDGRKGGMWNEGRINVGIERRKRMH